MAASLVLHLLVLLSPLVGRRVRVVAIKAPGTALGTHVTLVYSPGQAATQTAAAALKPVDSPLRVRAAKVTAARSSVTASLSPGAALNSSQGNNALGSGNVTVALATYFPWPRPDLSSLARGTRGDVVVDVTIDEQGRIIDSKLTQGLGEGIDQTVLAIIQTWTFKPATKDGVAIPSEQELLFHYEHG